MNWKTKAKGSRTHRIRVEKITGRIKPKEKEKQPIFRIKFGRDGRIKAGFDSRYESYIRRNSFDEFLSNNQN